MLSRGQFPTQNSNTSPPPGNGEYGSPVTEGGLILLKPTSRVELDFAKPSTEANTGSAVGREWSTPPCKPSPPQTFPSRPQGVEIPVTEIPRFCVAPVTVETCKAYIVVYIFPFTAIATEIGYIHHPCLLDNDLYLFACLATPSCHLL